MVFSKKESASEQEAKASPWGVLKEALSSKQSFTFFVMDPSHWLFLGLAACAIYGSFQVTTQVGSAQVDGDDYHIGRPTLLCGLTVCGLWFGTISSLFQATIQESINRFRALNSKLEEEVKQLSSEVDVLTGTSDRLSKHLESFEGIRRDMEAYAEKSGKSFDEIFGKTSSVFDEMNKMQLQKEKVLLEKVYTDLEFMDSQEGMTFTEFRRFCTRVPEKYRNMLKNQQKMFQDMDTNSDGVLTTAEMKNLIESLIQGIDNPQSA
mmetsp:Transcript_44302/g.122636  ORF Transcript_44302/g.122636 Transcript_44302/m.122636 type:complete len:264 (+) Transcript_44302:117-908(+)